MKFTRKENVYFSFLSALKNIIMNFSFIYLLPQFIENNNHRKTLLDLTVSILHWNLIIRLN